MLSAKSIRPILIRSALPHETSRMSRAANACYLRLLLATLLLLAAGCSRRESEAPKVDLSEKEKQQIRELNEQRASEWSSTRKK
jgi:hypothetical protein